MPVEGGWVPVEGGLVPVEGGFGPVEGGLVPVEGGCGFGTVGGCLQHLGGGGGGHGTYVELTTVKKRMLKERRIAAREAIWKLIVML